MTDVALIRNELEFYLHRGRENDTYALLEIMDNCPISCSSCFSREIADNRNMSLQIVDSSNFAQMI